MKSCSFVPLVKLTKWQAQFYCWHWCFVIFLLINLEKSLENLIDLPRSPTPSSIDFLDCFSISKTIDVCCFHCFLSSFCGFLSSPNSSLVGQVRVRNYVQLQRQPRTAPTQKGTTLAETYRALDGSQAPCGAPSPSPSHSPWQKGNGPKCVWGLLW